MLILYTINILKAVKEGLEGVCQLGDNCIQNFHLGRYIVGYTVGNFVFNFYTSKALNFVQNVSFLSDVNHSVDQSLATLLLTSGFRWYIAGYTVANY